MPRRLIFLPVVALIAAVAGIGLLLGGRAVTGSETEVIERVAMSYVSETGGAVTECSGRPAASPDLWLVVTCGGHEYFVDAYGRVTHVNAPEAGT
jgi:hypothetical protein